MNITHLNAFSAVHADLGVIAPVQAIPVSDAGLPPYRFVQALDTRIDTLFKTVEATCYWAELISPETPPDRVRTLLREILLSIHWYQAHTTEASDLMVRRLPRKKLRTLDILLIHLEQKAGCGRWVLNDYLALGGDHATAKTLPPDPAIFAVSSVWWHMAEVEDPWAYLGAEYLFEQLTVKIAPLLLDLCKAREIDCDRLHFLLDHATNSASHAQLIRELIVETVTRFPETEPSILRGFDYFQEVYPVPLWDAAWRRTLCEPGQTYRDPWRRYLDGLATTNLR
jgi:hypothetical protein